MTELADTHDPRPLPDALVQDALAFTRLGSAEAVTYFQAADERGAARALLRSYPTPAVEQSDRDLSRRGEECLQTLPDQGIPGYSTSARAAKVLLYVFLGAIVVVAGWAAVTLFAGDYDADPLLLPADLLVLPVEEILLLAPLALLALYVPCHLATVKAARTCTQAMLRWAAGHDETRTLGIPAKSPFVEISASWERLRFCAGAVIMMDGFLAVFLFAIREPDDPYGMFLLPVAIALPFLAVYALCANRVQAAYRRHSLLADRLFRVPSDVEDSLPASVSLEGLEYPATVEEIDVQEVDEETSIENTDWMSDFSTGSAPSDHFVEPERRES
ncbi:hypothetical protein ACTXO9_18305 [Brachybacterium tyrofermentans]|uniref:hypothetical protein n=1 Tax=Brachybacterium tyrofermentans TaxID=47848 RepID=UPI003FD3C298